jgi:hypothetical protein
MKTSQHLFTPSGHLATEALLDYHAGRMDRDDCYAVEQHLAGCSLCSEALDGMEQFRRDGSIQRVLHGLRASVRRRMKGRPARLPMVPRDAVAAIVFLILFLLIIYVIFFRTGLVR